MPKPLSSILHMLGLTCRAPKAHLPNIANFITALSAIAPPAGRGNYAFTQPDGVCHGFVQFIIHSDRTLEIHRLWTHTPGKGHGNLMLRKLCELADEHKVDLKLKALPIGRKPHPMTREQLKTWYQRHGFEGTAWKLLRRPVGGHTEAIPEKFAQF